MTIISRGMYAIESAMNHGPWCSTVVAYLSRGIGFESRYIHKCESIESGYKKYFVDTGTRTWEIWISMFRECATIALHPQQTWVFTRFPYSGQGLASLPDLKSKWEKLFYKNILTPTLRWFIFFIKFSNKN